MNAPVSLPSADVRNATRALFALAGRNSEQCILPLNQGAHCPDDGRPTFFCIHSISGAGGSDFLDLAKALEADVRFFGVQAPPKWIRQPDFGASVLTLAQAYAQAIDQAAPDGPILIGGWSAGATVALETARQLKARGRKIGLLVAIDAAPENTAAGLPFWSPRYLYEVARNLPAWSLEIGLAKPSLLIGRLHRGLTAFGEGLRRVRSGQPRPRPHPVAMFTDLGRYPAVQAKFMMRLYDAIMSYTPAPFTAPVLAYEAKITAPLHLPQVGRIWRKIAPQAEIVRLDGAHLTIVRPPYVQALARDLARRLTAITAGDQGDGAPPASSPPPSAV